MSKMRYTVAVDFDGVLHSYSSPWVNHWTIPDPPVEGAIEWLHEVAKKFDIVVHTTRGATPEGVAAVRRWLTRHGFDDGLVRAVTDRKIAALVYIDDRGFRFGGPGTFPTVQQIHDMRPWNK